MIAQNKKAFHDYHIIERLEAGVVLKGSEVVALRLGRCNLKDSFVRIIKGEIWLLNSHISLLNTTNKHYKHEERGARKLLLHRKQIDKMLGKVSAEGYTIVPLKIYFNHKNIAKVEIALAKGKNLHDKRVALKTRQLDIEAKAAMKDYR